MEHSYEERVEGARMTRCKELDSTWVPSRRWLCQVALGADGLQWVGSAMSCYLLRRS
jgi:hypothetical protein